MFYRDGSIFEEDKRVAVEGLTRVVAYVCGLDYEDVISNSRKRPFVDARKMVCKYVNDNIPLNHYVRNKNIALSAWFFNSCHSSVCHAVKQGNNLYKSDAKFARLYDAVVEIIDNPEYNPEFTYSDVYNDKKNWTDVRKNIHELLRVRYSFMPQYIREDIIQLYKKGYGEQTIADKVGTTMDLVQYMINREGLVKDKTKLVNKIVAERRLSFKPIMEVNY
jgi:hypothetical protein